MMPAINQQGAGTPRIYNETPTGDVDCVNTTYQAANEFDPDSLIVKIDGIILCPNQYLINADNRTFSLVIDPTDVNALHCPLSSSESIKIDYNSSIHACITSL